MLCPMDEKVCDCIMPCMNHEQRERLIKEDIARYRKAIDDANRMTDKGEVREDDKR